MILKETILSAFNERGTLLKWLKTVERLITERVLVKPVNNPQSTEIVAIDNTGTQVMLGVGAGLTIENGILKAVGGGSGGSGGTQLYQHVVMFSATVEEQTAVQPLHIITIEGTPFNMQTLASDFNHRYTKLATYLYDGSAMTPCELYTVTGGGWAVAFKDYFVNENAIKYVIVQGDIDINTPDTVTPL